LSNWLAGDPSLCLQCGRRHRRSAAPFDFTAEPHTPKPARRCKADGAWTKTLWRPPATNRLTGSHSSEGAPPPFDPKPPNTLLPATCDSRYSATAPTNNVASCRNPEAADATISTALSRWPANDGAKPPAPTSDPDRARHRSPSNARERAVRVRSHGTILRHTDSEATESAGRSASATG
jgi:hypothetical protein